MDTQATSTDEATAGPNQTTPAFVDELASVLNRFSRENASNTPDWILAQYLMACLAAWNVGVQQRETWYGRDARPSEAGGTGPTPVAPLA